MVAHSAKERQHGKDNASFDKIAKKETIGSKRAVPAPLKGKNPRHSGELKVIKRMARKAQRSSGLASKHKIRKEKRAMKVYMKKAIKATVKARVEKTKVAIINISHENNAVLRHIKKSLKDTAEANKIHHRISKMK